MSAHIRWTIGIVSFTLAFASFVAFDGPISLVSGVASICGGLVVGFIAGALLRDLLNPRDARRRSWQSVAALLGLVAGLLLGRTLPSGISGGAVASSLGGVIAAMAYFSPKLRDIES